MQRRHLLVPTLVLVAACALTSSADDGWSLSSLNPFASKPTKAKPSSSTRKISDSKSSGWSLNPFAKSSTSKSTSTRRKQEPGLITKTWETLTPWDDHPAKKPAPLVNPKSSKSKKEEKGWFDSWFSEEEPRRPRTVNEWLDQEKPNF